MRFTLIGDGPSDEILVPIASWLLSQLTSEAFSPQWADLRSYPRKLKNLSERVAATLELFPCDLLLVHRDAERESRESRAEEIDRALRIVRNVQCPPVVRVIPVRMQEAWLLFDEMALRTAAGCPNGTTKITLPQMRRIENLPDPKAVLYDLLKTASGLQGRRAKQFRPNVHARRLADLLENFEALRQLSSFQCFEEELTSALGILKMQSPLRIH